MRRPFLKAFTLIELLMVIAIIGILTGILAPSFRDIQKSVKKAASRARFHEWAAAIEAFKQEYGYYPWTNGSSTDVTLRLNAAGLGATFIETLSGRNASGEPVTTGGNHRALAFHHFSHGEFLHGVEADGQSPSHLVDAFNNDAILVVIDANGDGRVTAGSDKEIVHTGVAFWTLPRPPNISPDMTVTSWE